MVTIAHFGHLLNNLYFFNNYLTHSLVVKQTFFFYLINTVILYIQILIFIHKLRFICIFYVMNIIKTEEFTYF